MSTKPMRRWSWRSRAKPLTSPSSQSRSKSCGGQLVTLSMAASQEVKNKERLQTATAVNAASSSGTPILVRQRPRSEQEESPGLQLSAQEGRGKSTMDFNMDGALSHKEDLGLGKRGRSLDMDSVGQAAAENGSSSSYQTDEGRRIKPRKETQPLTDTEWHSRIDEMLDTSRFTKGGYEKVCLDSKLSYEEVDVLQLRVCENSAVISFMAGPHLSCKLDNEHETYAKMVMEIEGQTFDESIFSES
mmetsp:Transcript_32705/g.52653  ORF Transcript_32705/g.52653 Transcript_32705/m.52653 type:complete len:245 (-) Transcript_32705:67-801(-)